MIVDIHVAKCNYFRAPVWIDFCLTTKYGQRQVDETKETNNQRVGTEEEKEQNNRFLVGEPEEPVFRTFSVKFSAAAPREGT